MRGDDQQQDGMFSYISPNKRVPEEHPLRRIRSIVDRVLDQLSPRFRPGKEAKLSYHGHLMTENRSGLVVNTQVTTAYGSAECHAGLLMAEQLPGCGRVTLGADKGYDQREFVEELRCRGVKPHGAQNQGRRRSRLDQRTTRHPGYEISQRKRKRIEEVFGWMKTVGMLRQLRHRGLERVGWVFTLAAATYNLVRMRTLMPKCV